MITFRWRLGEMRKGLRIKEVAKERGMSLSSLAKKLGMHRSNMSAICSGDRGVSLVVLKKICLILDCSADELIWHEPQVLVYRDKKGQLLVQDIQSRNYDGMDKTWVNRVMLARMRHYKSSKRRVVK